MKISQRDLELKMLNCIVNHDTALDVANEKSLKDYHFLSKEPNFDIPLTGKLYKLALEYSESSGGCKLTESVLQGLLIQKGVKDKTQKAFMHLWDRVQEEESSLDELHHFISLMKDRYCVKLQAAMFDEVTECVNSDQIDKSINILSNYVNVMREEKDDFAKDKVAFNMAEAPDFFFKEYDDRAMNMDLYKGIYSGFKDIDLKTFGWMPSQLIVLLAPSSGGKSVQLLNWADYAWRVCHKNVMYFSFEMSSWLCKLRHTALISEVDYSDLKSITLSPEQRKKIEASFASINNSKYFEYIEAIEDPTPEFIEQKIREITLAKGKPDLIVVDYVGNMTTRSTSKTAKHWEKNGDAAEGLFKLAKWYSLPILTAQQINRESIKENRKRKEDGKASAYYQDAASGDQRLMHLAYYVIGMEPNKEDNICWYHPVKMRDAWFSPFATRWLPEYNKIVELTDTQQAALSLIKSADIKTNDKEYSKPAHEYVEESIDLSGWADDINF